MLTSRMIFKFSLNLRIWISWIPRIWQPMIAINIHQVIFYSRSSVNAVICLRVERPFSNLAALRWVISSLSIYFCWNEVKDGYTLCIQKVPTFVQLRIFPPRIKPAASHFARRFIGVQGRESQIFVKFAPPEAQNRTNRPACVPRPPSCKLYRRDAPT